MAKNPLHKVRVKKTGKIIEVYALSRKDKYCDHADCKTEYDVSELTFKPLANN